jgi:hypothetical protein
MVTGVQPCAPPSCTLPPSGRARRATAAPGHPAGAPLTGTVRWPDGAAGAFTITRDAASSVSGYVVTHVLAGTTSTFTQPTITRDANGAVTSRPAITVS